jgi:hypothetical protein
MKFDILFALTYLERVRAGIASKSGNFYFLALTAAFLSVMLIVFAWAVVFRKEARQSKPHRRRSKADEAGSSSDKHSEGRSKRRRRKEHRPANPTLAETGGLPAPRRGSQPPGSRV